MNRETAFLVMHLDVTQHPPRVHGIALFSEEKPTTLHLRQFRQFTVASGRGEDYTEGVENIRKQMAGPVRNFFSWCRPFMDDDTRERLGL
jgi:hypothetical protein